MSAFSSDYLYINERSVLHMSFIESMTWPDEDDEVVDVLQGDIAIDLSTVGGRAHRVSMNKQKNMFGVYDDVTNTALRVLIYEKWLRLLRK